MAHDRQLKSKELLKTVKVFNYDGLGFQIKIINAPMVKVYGKWALDIDMNKLQAEVAHALVFKPCRLSKYEIKFLRKFLEKSMEEFGKIFGVSHVAVVKWESGENKLTPSSEFYLRLTLLNHFHEKGQKYIALYEKIPLDVLESKKTNISIRLDAAANLKTA